VNLAGNLSQDAASTTYDTSAITVFDSSGASQTLTLHFVRDATNPLQWTAEVHDAKGAAIGTQTLKFNADGTLTGQNVSITATVTPKSAPKFDLTFSLGTAGTYAGVTNIATGAPSSVQASKVDGQALGAVTQYAFTDKGELRATYSNGNTKTMGTLVLAHFQTPDQLKEIGNGAFVEAAGPPTQGAALSAGLGRVVGGQIEMSNVDLTSQFTDLIIIQRGYQAGSQMVSTANEMMQQLLDMSRGR
jgi:flagellar hook protein FlgE